MYMFLKCIDVFLEKMCGSMVIVMCLIKEVIFLICIEYVEFSEIGVMDLIYQIDVKEYLEILFNVLVECNDEIQGELGYFMEIVCCIFDEICEVVMIMQFQD